MMKHLPRFKQVALMAVAVAAAGLQLASSPVGAAPARKCPSYVTSSPPRSIALVSIAATTTSVATTTTSVAATTTSVATTTTSVATTTTSVATTTTSVATTTTTSVATTTSTVSPPSSTPTPKNPPVPITSSGKLVVYWENWSDGSHAATLGDSSAFANVDVIIVAFGLPDSTGKIAFTPKYDATKFKSDINSLQSAGKTVLLSIGGAVGVNQLAMNPTTFSSSACALIEQYGFQGIDIDLEVMSGMEDQFNPSTLASALLSVKKCGPNGKEAIISLVPQTLDVAPLVAQTGKPGVYLQLLSQPDMKQAINWVQTQYYNSGSMLCTKNNQVYQPGTVDFITCQADFLVSSFGLSPSQVALGFPVSSAATGFVDASVVHDAVSCLVTGQGCGGYKPAAQYPVFGVMLWSINKDTGSAYSKIVKEKCLQY